MLDRVGCVAFFFGWFLFNLITVYFIGFVTGHLGDEQPSNSLVSTGLVCGFIITCFVAGSVQSYLFKKKVTLPEQEVERRIVAQSRQNEFEETAIREQHRLFQSNLKRCQRREYL